MELELNHIYDKMQQCIVSQSPTFTDFIDIGLRKKFLNATKQDKNVIILDYTCFLDDERRVIGFFPSTYTEFMTKEQMQEIFPLRCLKITWDLLSKDSLNHRDFLGSILGLGLERKLFGDIIVDDNAAYIVCQERIVPLLEQELIFVKHSSVSIRRIDDLESVKLLAPKSTDIRMTVASLRLDVIIKGVLNLSRTSCNELIEQGHVKVNQMVIMKNHKIIETGDVLSIAKKGKFKIGTIEPENKKGRIPVTVIHYI